MSDPAVSTAFRNRDTLARLDRYRGLARHLVFVFFDPWTLLTGTSEPLLAAIRAHGFTVATAIDHVLSEGDVEQIYRKNLPIRPGGAWHVARQVYAMGTSRGLLLHHRGGAAAETLQRLKGRSNPALNAPGHLRYDFLAPNRSLSLLHASDSWQDTLQESLVFFAPDLLDWTLDRLERGQIPPEPITAAWQAGLESLNPSSPAALLLRMRLRAAAALRRPAGAAAGLPPAPLEPLTRLWQEHLKREDPRRPVVESMGAYLDLIPRERPLLEALVAAATATAGEAPPRPLRLYHAHAVPAADLVGLLLLLNRPAEYEQVNAAALPAAAAVLVDRWEDLLFKTTLFNFDDFLGGSRCS